MLDLIYDHSTVFIIFHLRCLSNHYPETVLSVHWYMKNGG